MATIKVKIPEDIRPLKLDPNGWGIDWGWADVEKLRFDWGAYQRDFNESKADRIAREFDPHKFDPIRVNIRPDKSQWVVDGQHRVVAARKRLIPFVPALFQQDETIQQEAEQFIDTNTRRTKPTSIALFKASLTAGRPDALEVERILRETGWTIAKNSNTKAGPPGTFSSPSMALNLYKRYGAENLFNALYVLRKVWPNDRAASHAHLVSGMTRLLFKYGDVIKVGKLTDKLATMTPTTVINNGKTLSTALPGSNAVDIADSIGAVLLSQYQKGKRGAKWDWNDRRIKIQKPSGTAERIDVRNVKPEKKEKVEKLLEQETETAEPVEAAETPPAEPTVEAPNGTAEDGDALTQLIRETVQKTK